MSHHIHVLKPNLPGDGIRGGACGVGLGHEAGALLNGISATAKLRELLTPSHWVGEDTAERWAVDQPGSDASPDTESGGTSILDFPVSETEE